MSEYHFIGILFFGTLLATFLLYLAIDYTDRRRKRRRTLRQKRREQRHIRRNNAVIYQAEMDELYQMNGEEHSE